MGPLASPDDLPRSGKTAVITDDDKVYIKHMACCKPKEFGHPEEPVAFRWTYKMDEITV